MTAAPVGCRAGRVDGAGTRRRLQALVAIGWPQVRLAARLGIRPAAVAALMRREHVTAAATAAVGRLYDELWDKPSGGYAGARARAHAAARGWPPPLGWDEPGDSTGHAIDDPDATPAPGWKRAGRRTQPGGQIVAEARWLMGQGFTREQAAARLGISRAGLEKAFARVRAAATTPPSGGQGGTTMPETRQQQRSIPCTCGARRGEQCTPKGDHLGRFMDAEKRGKIGRPELARAVDDLTATAETEDVAVIAPAAIVPARRAGAEPQLEREAG